MKSMTGYGRGEQDTDGHVFTVELKTVNHRYLEPSVRMSRGMNTLEQTVRTMLKEHLSRGKVDVFVNYQNHSDNQGTVWVNEPRMRAYLESLRASAAELGVEDDLKLSQLAMLPDVLSAEAEKEDMDFLRPILEAALLKALEQLDDMRRKEGENLKADLKVKLSEMETEVAEVEKRAPLVVENYKQKLYERIEANLDRDKVPALDEGRLESEITIFSDRCCIDEEITRLKSHLKQYRALIEKEEPLGRQLDFLTQELNREANTISSKANDLEITKHALNMKNIIEKIREQVQNIE